MISMKSTLFYSILLASVLGGAGAGYVVAPSKSDMQMAQEMARECMPEKKMPKGPIYNSPAQGY